MIFFHGLHIPEWQDVTKHIKLCNNSQLDDDFFLLNYMNVMVPIFLAKPIKW